MPINKCTGNDGVNGEVRNHILSNIIVISDSDKPQMEDILQSNWPYFSKISKY